MFIFHTPSPKKEFVEDRKKVGIMTESFLKLTPLDLTVDMLSHFTVYPSEQDVESMDKVDVLTEPLPIVSGAYSC